MELLDYVDLPLMKKYVGDDLDGVVVEMDDTLLQESIHSAAREVDRRAKRTFGKDTVASEREFTCRGNGILVVDDFWTTTDLLIDGVPYASTEHKLFPRNGTKSGLPGFPYESIKHCRFYKGQDVVITAKWGWADVPPTVVELTKMIAAENYVLRGAPLGVKGENQFGAIRVREKYHVEQKLKLYTRDKLRLVL